MLNKLSNLFKSGVKKPYQLFQIEPSLECNLECVMCPWRELRPEQAQMSGDTFSRIARYLPLAHNVDFTGGGEPTTNPGLPNMVRVVKEAGCEVGFSTNGTLLNRDLAHQLIALKQDWISFSVDGATAETYNQIRQGAQFDQVTANIETLRDLKAAAQSQTPRMMMVFVMMQQNYHELPRYVDLARELGVEQVIFKNLDVILKDEDDQRRLFGHDGPRVAELQAVINEARRRANRHGIGLRQYALQPQELPICEHDPLHNLFFNWAGYVSPCITLSYAETRVFNGQSHHVPCRQFGNINENTLEEIWDKADYRQFREPFTARVRLHRQATLDALTGGSPEPSVPPPAPRECQTCYYLYGI